MSLSLKENTISLFYYINIVEIHTNNGTNSYNLTILKIGSWPDTLEKLLYGKVDGPVDHLITRQFTSHSHCKINYVYCFIYTCYLII